MTTDTKPLTGDAYDHLEHLRKMIDMDYANVSEKDQAAIKWILANRRWLIDQREELLQQRQRAAELLLSGKHGVLYGFDEEQQERDWPKQVDEWLKDAGL